MKLTLVGVQFFFREALVGDGHDVGHDFVVQLGGADHKFLLMGILDLSDPVDDGGAVDVFQVRTEFHQA